MYRRNRLALALQAYARMLRELRESYPLVLRSAIENMSAAVVWRTTRRHSNRSGAGSCEALGTTEVL